MEGHAGAAEDAARAAHKGIHSGKAPAPGKRIVDLSQDAKKAREVVEDAERGNGRDRWWRDGTSTCSPRWG